jgi:hypothetical protein
MGFKDMISSVSGDAKNLLDLGADKVMQLLTDYKNATKQLEPLGFKPGKLMVGMGVLPEVHTSLIGDIGSVDVQRLTTMMEEKKDDKVLGSLLKALIIAKKIHGHIESKLQTVTLQITLGVPPSVAVELS